MALVRIIALPMAAIAFVAPAHADDWAVSKIKYKHEGAYWSYFTFAAQDREGKTRECNAKNQNANGLENGDSITLRIDNSDESTNMNWKWENCAREKGSEVWGIVYIDHSGGVATGKLLKRKSCRKDHARYFYHPHSGVVVVKTKGTTENNNRCRIEHNGGVRWDEAVHGPNIYQD